jgi:hypothetical protein
MTEQTEITISPRLRRAIELKVIADSQDLNNIHRREVSASQEAAQRLVETVEELEETQGQLEEAQRQLEEANQRLKRYEFRFQLLREDAKARARDFVRQLDEMEAGQ